MNGREWGKEHTERMIQNLGRSDAFIAGLLGFAEITVRKRRGALGLKAYGQRKGWTRRQWLMHDAAGLDFQISDCRR
jgi:hypothetical protein